MLIKLMCNYCQSKNQQNWLSDKNCTVPVHELFDHPSYSCIAPGTCFRMIFTVPISIDYIVHIFHSYDTFIEYLPLTSCEFFHKKFDFIACDLITTRYNIFHVFCADRCFRNCIRTVLSHQLSSVQYPLLVHHLIGQNIMEQPLLSLWPVGNSPDDSWWQQMLVNCILYHYTSI